MGNFFAQFDPNLQGGAPTAAPVAGQNFFAQFDPNIAPPPQQPGMIARMANDINQGSAAKDAIQQQYNNGQISLPESAFEKLGATGQQVGSAMFEPVKYLYNTGMKMYPQAVQNNINSGMAAITGGVNSAANAIDNTQVGKAVNGYMAQNPRVAAMVNAVPGVASLIAPASGAESATGSVLGDAVKEATPTTPVTTLAQQAAESKAKASAGYTAQPNITLTPEQEQGLRNNLASLVPGTEGSIQQNLYNKGAAAGHIQDITDPMSAGTPTTFNDLLSARKDIGFSWANAKKAGDFEGARDINDVKNAVTQAMTTPETVDWLQANRQSSIAQIQSEFAKGVQVAATRAQPANALDAFINKYQNSYKAAQLGDNESNILDQITNNSYTDEVKRSIASRLAPYAVSGIGSMAGAGIGSLVGMPGMGAAAGAAAGDLAGIAASKAGREALFNTKVAGLQEFFDELNKRPMPTVPEAPATAPQPQLSLPSPTSARPMSDAEIAQARQQINNPTPKTGGVPVGNPEGNPVPKAQSTVRNPDGMLEKAIKEPIGSATANEGYQNLTWINQRQVDKIIPQYTANTISRAQALRSMAQIGLSPRDADQILTSAYQSKIWRKQ